MGRPTHALHRRIRAPARTIRCGTRHDRALRSLTAGDGHVVLLAIQNEPEWARFCEIVIDNPGLATDPRFTSNTLRVEHREDLDPIITAAFAARTTAELEERLSRARIAFAGVNTVTEFLDHPVLAGRDRWRTVATETGDIRALLPPIGFDTEARMDPVPALGAHTESVLRELGTDTDDIDALLGAARA